MASVAELLPRAARLKYELEVQLRAVEQGNGDAGDCGMGLRELFTQINTLRQLLNAERPERRNLWKVKIDELGHEAQFLSNDLRRVTNFHQHQRERDSLFRRRAGAAPSSAHDDLLEAEDSYARSGNQVDRGVLSFAHRCRWVPSRAARPRRWRVASPCHTVAVCAAAPESTPSGRAHDVPL